MKNLKLIYCKIKNLGLRPSNVLMLNPNQNDLIYIWSDNGVHSINIDTGVHEKLLEVNNLIAAEYLMLSDEISCATKDGEVIVYNVDRKANEVVSFCDGGIEAMAWSPDQEVVAFVTSLRNVVVMSCSYDPILESSLDDTAFGDQEFIALGWGKKETQFHGSEGKQAAKKKEAFTVPDDLEILDKRISITWRGDGHYFAVSFVGKCGRMFKVYDKEGRLQYTSEKISNIGIPISWRLSGNWIAVPHELPSKYTIALFEKNGLRHREIVLPFKSSDEIVKHLSWSGDSDILAVETVRDGKSLIYLYIIGNYHWYLKQCLEFHTNISRTMWDVMGKNGKCLYVLLNDGIFISYRWEYCINHTNGNSPLNHSVVGVIDCNKLKLTDMRNNVIPPPMFASIAETSSNISFCGFIQFPETEREMHKVFTVDNMNKVKIFTMKFEQNQQGKFKLHDVLVDKELTVKNQSPSIPLNLNHWLWLGDDVMIYCQSLETSTKIVMACVNSEQNQTELIVKDALEIPGHVGTLAGVNSQKFVAHLINGHMYSIKIDSKSLRDPKLLFVLPEFCDVVQCTEHNENLKTISLKTKQNLYVNNTKVASDVTSFFLTEKYLVFTHLNIMKFMLLENGNVTTERKIERGGKLVIIVPKDSRTILQMPRGNLEAIEPRALSLCIIGELLERKEYRRAMDILRKQRINLNVIVDHNPKQFVKNIDIFIEEISNPQWLNLFLSDLQNEDCTKTMYSGSYTQANEDYPEYYSVENKVNFLCDHICDRMKAKNFNKYILPIITCYVKKNEVEKALNVIWIEKKKENEEQQNTLSEEALKYLLYLVNVNELFNVALGMYDFGLVLFVAKRSQKDPKEYVPFLNELNKLELNYRKFKIDEHLKRYKAALTNLCKCGEDHFEECLHFVQKHKLYAQALMELEDKPDLYKKVALAFADHLRAQGKLSSASLMYERGGDLSQAIMSARHVLDWQRCISLTNILGKGNMSELASISESLVPALQEHGKFEEAAFLIKTYCNDLSQSVSILIKGHLYLKAIYESRMSNPSLIENLIEPHLETYKDILQSTMESDKEQFLKFKTRLITVRTDKQKKLESDEQLEENIDECDILSDVSTINSSRHTSSSKGSGKTFRSSKNRRKHERKLLSLKHGNPFEDIALIDAIYNLIQKITNQQSHVRDICRALFEISYDRDARQIQNSFADLLNTVKSSLDDIWIPEMLTNQVLGQDIDYAQIQKDQHYSMIKPFQRFKPDLNIIDWEHEILK